MVKKSEEYSWSSAAAHCHLKDDKLLSQKLAQIPDWSAWLAEREESEQVSILRRNIDKGLPYGTDRFVNKLEKLAGRALKFQPQGRPKKEQGRA